MTTIALSQSRARRGALRAAVTGVLAAATLLLPTAAQAASPTDQITAVDGGGVSGYTNVIDGHAVNTRLLKFTGGGQTEVYCVQFGVAYDPKAIYSPVDRADSGITAAATAATIAASHATIGTPLADVNAETTATQLAIWKLTDNTDYSKVNNAAIRGRADALISAATPAADIPAPVKLSTVSSTTGVEDTIVVTATTGAKPLAGATLTITAPGFSGTVLTDDAGKASVTFDAPKKAASATIEYAGTLPAGTVMTAPKSQTVITTSDAAYTIKVTAPAAAAKQAGAQGNPTTKPAAAKPTTLPHTGGPVPAWMLALGLAGAAAAAATAIVARRTANRH